MEKVLSGHAKATDDSIELLRKVGSRVVQALAWRPDVKAGLDRLSERMARTLSKPWFFPLAVCVGMSLLWLQQHGYLQVPISVCQWSFWLAK